VYAVPVSQVEGQTVTVCGSDDRTVRVWDADSLTTAFEDEILTVAATAEDGLAFAAPLGILHRRLDREFMI
jgi:hypothetical protein